MRASRWADAQCPVRRSAHRRERGSGRSVCNGTQTWERNLVCAGSAHARIDHDALGGCLKMLLPW